MRRLALLTLFALVAGGLFAPSASASPHPGPSANIVETLVARSGGGALDNNSGDYDILIQAVLAADLAGVLSDPATKFTLFAPNDAAFMRTVRDLTGSWPASEQAAFDAVAGLGIPAVTQVLLYHVVGGRELGALSVLFSRHLTMANGGNLGVRLLRLVDADPDAPDAYLRLNALNIRTSNGTIHGITRVLRPIDL
jgi:uncharacterized surface protein with fasciclin (FAS1) repeats